MDIYLQKATSLPTIIYIYNSLADGIILRITPQPEILTLKYFYMRTMRLASSIQFLIILYLIQNNYSEIVVEPDLFSPARVPTSL
jgi:hypothetical protein